MNRRLWYSSTEKVIFFHTPMSHENGQSLQCVGFITTLNRACIWLATSKVIMVNKK